ncbi:unnamed protein product [Withania somnifera]
MPSTISADDRSNPIVVAIDKDKHSPSAVKWAIDHLVISNPTLVLVHVRMKNSPNRVGANGASQSSNGGLSDQDTNKVFTPFGAYSARKGIAVKEVVIEDISVSKGLLDYINGFGVSNIVLGASSRSAFSRKFWTHDVPTIVNKDQQSVRPAAKPLTSSSARLPPSRPWSAARLRREKNILGHEMMPKSGTSNASMDSHHVHTRESKNSYGRNCSSDDSGLFAPLSQGSIDVIAQILDFTQVSLNENCSSSSSWEPEMNRLKLELRQTMDMYNTACKEAASANQIAKELHQWKPGEANRFKQPMEKAKGVAATEAAQKSQRLAEIEAKRRKYASGYGPVYKGRLDHTHVAIKVTRSDAAQGMQQHPNMVLLLGAYPEYGCLVYEFMDNGSLEDRLKYDSKLPAEIATGLLFLHQAKPNLLSIMTLSQKHSFRRQLCRKISDVGLARLVPPSVADCVTQYHMTSATGTFCYIDPKYQRNRKLGTKSDIYSLGVMFLQIITARPPMGLTHHVERAIENGTFADILDPTVPNWLIEEALNYAKLSLKCAKLRKKDRPDLGSVIPPKLNRLKELGMSRMPSTVAIASLNPA